MIISHNPDSAIEVINSLTPESYNQMSFAMVDNYLRARHYQSYTDLMTKYIMEGKDWLEKNNLKTLLPE